MCCSTPTRVSKSTLVNPASSAIDFRLNVSFDQVLAPNIGYALVRRQSSIGGLPAYRPTRASTGADQFGNHCSPNVEVDMTEITKPEAMSRRKALALVGLGTVLGLAASSVSVSEAEAQTVGMDRRQHRRGGRTDRRQDRRTGRTDRRQDRRTGRT